MKQKLVNLLKKVAQRVKLIREFPIDFNEDRINTIIKVRPYTLTSPARIFALCEAVEYIVRADIPGSIVECGVWRGGSMMSVAQTLLQLEDQSRDIYLFDTFEGMTQPSELDVSAKGESASKLMKRDIEKKENSVWCYASLEEVQSNFQRNIKYRPEKIHFIKGNVKKTIPKYAPSKISLLRLDTDWYESTYHELVNLFPRISSGGVIIIDDYGQWKGARKAVNQYIQEHNIKILLNRIDETGRIGVVL